MLTQRPLRADAEEWTFVRRHPLIGEREPPADTVAGIVPVELIADVMEFGCLPQLGLVHSTHERFDGSGYPDGLAGEQIPLGARIIAVCDAFTAMTFPRPYAPQLPVTQAIAELRNCAGSQFDPAVVDALTNLVIGLPWPPAAATANASHRDPVPDRT